MTHIEDLAPYGCFEKTVLYLPDRYISFRHDPARTLAVGWLGDDCPHSGPVDGGLLDAVRELMRHQSIALTRGFHTCEICGPVAWADMQEGEAKVLAGEFGNGELRVPGEGGVVYAAPVMLWHYLSAHGYRPPSAFTAAAKEFVSSGRHRDMALLAPPDAVVQLHG
ncbi:hypothetical protein ACIRBX_13600 [Kitasatospora sp. NPDC096147]|uniref:DUF7919 family protein n=1 Tax=Kitasatospora sp. NPDC096147 TaxID=3364093 RepID=UPI003803DEDD